MINKEYYHDFGRFFYQINKEDQQSVIAKMVKDILLLFRNAKPPRSPAPGRRKGWIGDIHAAHPIRLLSGPSGIVHLAQHASANAQW